MSRARAIADWIPELGAAGTVLTKATLASYDTVWAAPSGGGLPPITPVADQGKALVIDATDAPAWGAQIDNPTQIIEGGVIV